MIGYYPDALMALEAVNDNGFQIGDFLIQTCNTREDAAAYFTMRRLLLVEIQNYTCAGGIVGAKGKQPAAVGGLVARRKALTDRGVRVYCK